MKINTQRKSGFTLVEIMIVVAIIGLLAAIAIPNFVKARTSAQVNACIANLKQIESAKEQWALETKAAPTAAGPALATLSGPSGWIKVLPTCPATGVYTVGNLDENPNCTIALHVLP